MQEFNKNTVESSFIKGLLENTPVPTIKTVVEGDMIISGQNYIFRSNTIYCLNTGIVGEPGTEFDIIGPYDFGLYYPQFTHKYVSNTDYYDTKTHEWLGEYLRAYRDIKGVDLMPLYNCYSDCTINTVRIDDNEVVTTKNSPYKIVKIPMRFDKAYTICIECNSPVKIATAFMRNKHLLSINSENLNSILWNKPGVIKSFGATMFKSPIIFKVSNKDVGKEILSLYERNLYMLIQLPKTHATSILVLEGDYTNTNSKKIVDYNSVITMKDRELDRICQSNLSLMMLSGYGTVPFSKELVPYLLLHPITKAERIDDNITRIRNRVGYSYNKRLNGVWSNELRYGILRKTEKNHTRPRFDMNGYVDTQTEKILYSSIRR